MAVGSVGSNWVSLAVTVAPAGFTTVMALNAGSTGSVNQMITRSGGASRTCKGSGDALRRLACADAGWLTRMVARQASNAKTMAGL